MNDDLRHDIRFRVAFDKRSPEPNKNYGIGDMHIIFLVIGPKGAVQWLIGTGWYVDSACKHLMGFARNSLTDQRRPNGWDLGYHSKEPKYEDQSPMDQCDICEPCYYDGSSLNAELPIEAFAEFKAGADLIVHLGGATQYLDFGESSASVAA